MTGPPPVSIVGGRSSTSPSPACKGDIEQKGPHIQQKGLVIYYYIDIQWNSSNIPDSRKLPQTPYTPKYLFSGEKDRLPICNKPTIINPGWWHGRSKLMFWWGLLHSKRLLLNSAGLVCGRSLEEKAISLTTRSLVSRQWKTWIPLLWPQGWGFPNAIRYSKFSYILQCRENAFILPLICSQQCAMICFTTSESSQTSRWAQTREQQLSACLSLLPSAMIAAKAKEAWHEDNRAFPQSESFFWDSLIFEKGVAITCYFHFPSREESVNQIFPTRNTGIAEPCEPLGRGRGCPQNVRVRMGARIGVNYVEFGTG